MLVSVFCGVPAAELEPFENTPLVVPNAPKVSAMFTMLPVSDAVLVDPLNVWVWAGRLAVDSEVEELPPVAPTEYAEPAPTMNLSCRFGVPFVPSHKYQPLGIAAIDPDHMIMPPDGNTAATASETAFSSVSTLSQLEFNRPPQLSWFPPTVGLLKL